MTGEVSLHDVRVAHGDHVAVEGVSGAFPAGRMTAVVGPNGAGKTSLIRAMAGLLPIASGRITRPPDASVAYLAQHATFDRGFPLSVGDLVAMGQIPRAGWFRALDHAAARARALEQVGLAGLGDRPIGALSVGQLQRALFARAMLRGSAIMLLDEPFAAIDAATQDDLLALMRGWAAAGRIVIAVLHDLDQVREHFPESVLLARRCIAWGPSRDVLSPENLRRARRSA